MAQSRGICRRFGGLTPALRDRHHRNCGIVITAIAGLQSPHCGMEIITVNDARTVAGRLKRPLAAGPVAQWLEPAAHNGLVAGSSPAGPTSDYSSLLNL
jgi:hypothetical protein